jgi:hypothetical protein
MGNKSSQGFLSLNPFKGSKTNWKDITEAGKRN